jgi:hypothetical protein
MVRRTAEKSLAPQAERPIRHGLRARRGLVAESWGRAAAASGLHRHGKPAGIHPRRPAREATAGAPFRGGGRDAPARLRHVAPSAFLARAPSTPSGVGEGEGLGGRSRLIWRVLTAGPARAVVGDRPRDGPRPGQQVPRGRGRSLFGPPGRAWLRGRTRPRRPSTLAPWGKPASPRQEGGAARARRHETRRAKTNSELIRIGRGYRMSMGAWRRQAGAHGPRR